MKIMKYFIILLLVIGLGISAWIYYPQYQINKIKKNAVAASKEAVQISYMDYFRNSEAPQIYHLALGDSVIRGFGAKPDENLVYQFSSKLETQINKKIEFKNEGINGITSTQLNQLVQEGRFDEAIKISDIVTINVGGNDILKIGINQNFQSLVQSIDGLQSTFSKNLSDIAQRINMLNPNATIVFLELYNPLSPTADVYKLADKLLPNWNLKIYEVANQYSSSIVIETTKVINGENLQNLSHDGVHPNSEGYMAISEQMIYQFKNQYRKESI